MLYRCHGWVQGAIERFCRLPFPSVTRSAGAFGRGETPMKANGIPFLRIAWPKPDLTWHDHGCPAHSQT